MSDVLTASPPALRPVRNSLRAFSAVFDRERVLIFGEGYGLSFIASILEPLFHIGLVLMWHWMISIFPVYGTSKVLFVSSGMYPLFVFIQLSSAFHGVTKSDGPMRRFPRYDVMDVIAARAVINITLYLIVGMVLFGSIYYFITPLALPFNPLAVMLSLFGLVLLGIGVGLCNAAITPLLPMWGYVYQALARSLILFGGILYVPDFLPPYLREWLVWSPTLHGVELFRQGFYPAFPTLLYSPTFFFGSGLASVVVGFMMLRLLRRYLQNY